LKGHRVGAQQIPARISQGLRGKKTKKTEGVRPRDNGKTVIICWSGAAVKGKKITCLKGKKEEAENKKKVKWLQKKKNLRRGRDLNWLFPRQNRKGIMGIRILKRRNERDWNLLTQGQKRKNFLRGDLRKKKKGQLDLRAKMNEGRNQERQNEDGGNTCEPSTSYVTCGRVWGGEKFQFGA